MNTVAAKFFHHCLMYEPCGAQAREYIAERKLAGATVKHFYLGYAPNDFGLLRDHLRKNGFTEEEMIVGFLCGKSEKTGRAYDYFRNRVIFPIVDTSRNIVAFGGRVMDDSKPKYLNTSDTPAFKKSKNLFALNYAKDHCAEQLILCEGYMDVIALHQAGFENAVATLGTAITEEHARIIAKYTKRVIISYDSDEAGVNAANKAMRLLGAVGVEVRVLKMEGAKDPDEYIKKFGAASFKSLIEQSRTGFEYKLEAVTQRYDVSQTEQKLRAVAEVVGIISDYYSGVEREVYVMRAAERLKVSADALAGDVEKQRNKKLWELKNAQTKEAHASIRDFGDRINPDAAKNPRAAAAEETILGLLLLYPEQRDAVLAGQVSLTSDDFVTAFSRRAFDAIMRLHGEDGGFVFSLLGADFTADEMGRLQSLEVNRRSLTDNGVKVLNEAVAVLRGAKAGAAEKSLGDALEEKRKKLAAQKQKNNK
jgi:DNA primase